MNFDSIDVSDNELLDGLNNKFINGILWIQ